jgi:D-alanyl-lipoteichoic acid acyltransferase DltB (MBOAT superfamily)
MLRCMSNNYSGMAFWRSWHRSFYLWILRYIYIPLGGSKSVIWSIWPVFMFVAVWHDMRLHLLAWSWLICLFFLPEIMAGWLKERLRMEEWDNYRFIAGLAATVSICMMMTANLVGFAVGIDGMKMLWRSIVTVKGALFLLNALCTTYSASQVMFEIRAEERRKGIFNNF